MGKAATRYVYTILGWEQNLQHIYSFLVITDEVHLDSLFLLVIIDE